MALPLDAEASLLTLVAATGRDYGWAEAPLDPGLARVHMECPRGRFDAVCRLLIRGERRVLLTGIRPADAASPAGPAETPDDLFRRYLDISLLERLALWGLARPSGADSLLCITPDAARLLDVRREVAWADLAGTDAESVHAILRRLEAPPAVDSAALAHEMRRWTDLNAGPLGRVLHWSRGETERLLRQAILGLRCLAASTNLEPLGLSIAASPEPPSAHEQQEKEMQAGRPHHNADDEGVQAGCPHHSERDEETQVEGMQAGRPHHNGWLRWAPEPAVAWLDRLLAAAQEFAPAGAGAWSSLERRALERQLAGEDGRQACEALRDSLLRLARSRISATVQLRLLLPAKPELTAWRLALTQPLQVRDELPSADLYVFAPLRLDPRECGMGRVLEAYEKLARYAAREMRDLVRAGGRQLDLFAAEPEFGGGPPPPAPAGDAGERVGGAAFGAAGPFDWVCRHALRIAAPEPALRDAIGYLIALHTLDVAPLEEEGGTAALTPLAGLSAMFEG